MKHIKFIPDWEKHLRDNKFDSTGMYPVGKHIPQSIEYIDRIAPFLLEIVGNRDINLFVRGSSGAILGGLLVKTIPNKVNIFHIKKEGELSHGGSDVYGISEDAINVILDDFIATGETINKIWKAIDGIVDKIDILIVSEFTYIDYEKPFPLNFFPDYIITEGKFKSETFTKKKKLQDSLLDLVKF